MQTNRRSIIKFICSNTLQPCGKNVLQFETQANLKRFMHFKIYNTHSPIVVFLISCNSSCGMGFLLYPHTQMVFQLLPVYMIFSSNFQRVILVRFNILHTFLSKNEVQIQVHSRPEICKSVLNQTHLDSFRSIAKIVIIWIRLEKLFGSRLDQITITKIENNSKS